MKTKSLIFLILTAVVSIFSTALYAAPYDDLIVKYSYEHGLDPNLVRSVIYRESHFNPNARSKKSARANASYPRHSTANGCQSKSFI